MNSKQIEQLINRTKPQQWALKRFRVSAPTLAAWRARGLPAVVIQGEARDVIRYIPAEAVHWVRQYRKAQK